MSRLSRGASQTFAARGLALVIGIASSVILARLLGPEGRGEYTLIILIPALIQITGVFGADTAAIYLIARRRDEAAPIGFTLAAIGALLGLLLIVVYGAVSQLEPYAHYLETAHVPADLIWILVALLPVTLAASILTAAVLGLEQYRRYNLATLAAPIANLILLLVLVVGMRMGIAGAVAAAAAASALGLAAAAAAFFAVAPGRVRWQRGLVSEAFSYGVRAHVANLAWFLHYRADMFLVGYLTGPAALGYYAVAVGLAEKLYLVPSAVGTVLFPRIAAAEPEEARRVTPRACRHTLWLTIGFSLILALVAQPLIHGLYGARFSFSVAPLWLLLPGIVSLAVSRLLSADLNGRGMPGVVARANAGMAVLNIALNLWWIPLWGVMGAAAATSVSYSATVILLTRRYVLTTGVPVSELVRFTREDRRELLRAASLLERSGPTTKTSEQLRP